MTATAVAQPDPGAPAVYRLPKDDPHPAQASIAAEAADDGIETVLSRNAVWFCRLRWIVVGTLALAGGASLFPRPLATLGLTVNPAWPWVAASVLAAANLVFIRLAAVPRGPGRGVPIKLQLWSQIVTDLIVLTVVIHWLGSGLPAVPFMYLFHLILACIVFTPRESLLVAGLAAGLFTACLLLEARAVLPPSQVFTAAGVTGDTGVAGGTLRGGNLAALLLIWAVIWYLVSRLAGTLLERERELALTNLRLEASSEERARHMLQTTHQLKAPFAAIHAHAQLLLGGYCGTLPDAARDVVGKISNRCMALSRQIQEMLQLANLRSLGQSAPPRKALDLAALVEAAIHRVEPAARQRGVRIRTALEPLNVQAVEDHLTMLVDNLVVNAVTYSKDNGEVQVDCRAAGPGTATLVVRDHGIGIPREKLPRVFEDYYRTEEAVQHNRMSTGLGLAIVRQVAREARLGIQVESAPGWGTRFTVTIPEAQAA